MLKPYNNSLSIDLHIYLLNKILLYEQIQYYDTLQPQPPPVPQLPVAHPPSVNASPSLGTITCSLTLSAIYSLTSSKKRCKLRSANLKEATYGSISIFLFLLRIYFLFFCYSGYYYPISD